LKQLVRTILKPAEKYRIAIETSTINTCSTKTVAELQITGTLPQSSDICQSNAVLRVIPAEKCDYEFILTEIVQDRANQGSFVKIYSPNCAGMIITDNFQLVKYRGKGKPLEDATDLKGLKIDMNGFMTICASRTANALYGKDTCNMITGILSPADSVPGESLAIIEGGINDAQPFSVLDTFGSIKKDESGPD